MPVWLVGQRVGDASVPGVGRHCPAAATAHHCWAGARAEGAEGRKAASAHGGPRPLRVNVAAKGRHCQPVWGGCPQHAWTATGKRVVKRARAPTHGVWGWARRAAGARGGARKGYQGIVISSSPLPSPTTTSGTSLCSRCSAPAGISSPGVCCTPGCFFFDYALPLKVTECSSNWDPPGQV